jgi:hypothetical protein
MEESIFGEKEGILNSLDEEVDSDGEGSNGGNGKELLSYSDPDALGEAYTFKDPPEPVKKKSRLSRLGIELPEKKAPAALTEEEQRKADELASEFKSFLTVEKSEDFWKSFGSENSF